MPFALVPLVVVGAALLGLVAAMGFAALMRAIANVLPRINIVVTTIDLGAPFAYAAGKIEPYITRAFKSTWKHVGAWFHAHAWTLLSFLAPITGAIRDLVTQVNHHTTTAIPNATKAAVRQAAEHANAVGSTTLEQAKAAAANDLVTAKDYANAQRHAAEQVAHDALATVEHNLGQRLTKDEAQIAQLIQATAVTIPADIAASVGRAKAAETAQLNAARSALTTRIDTANQAIKAANQAIAGNEASITDNVAKIASLEADLASAAHAAAAATGAAKAALQRQVDSLNQDILNLSSGIATNQTAIAAARGHIDTLTNELDTANGAIGRIDARTTLTAAQDAVLGVAAGASVATAVTVVGAEMTKLAECAVTACAGPNNLSNLLEKELPKLLGVASLAGIGTFLEQAIQDPSGAASATTAVATVLESAGMNFVDLIKAL